MLFHKVVIFKVNCCLHNHLVVWLIDSCFFLTSCSHDKWPRTLETGIIFCFQVIELALWLFNFLEKMLFVMNGLPDSKRLKLTVQSVSDQLHSPTLHALQTCYAPTSRVGALSNDARLTSVAYIRPKSRTERPRKAKIGTEVGHVTHNLDTTFKVRRSKINLQGAGAYCGGLPHSLLLSC